MARSNEPLWWGPFMAGAGMSAFLMPILIVLTSLGVYLGFVTEERLWGLLHYTLIRLFLVVLISLSLFHAAHRLRFVLVDLGLKNFKHLIAIFCYGGAIVGTALAILLIRVGS